MKQKRANDGGFSALISTKFAIFATFIRHFSTANSDNEDGNSLSHLDSKSGDARMVDVGRKETSPERIALAQAVVQFPEGVLAKLLQQGENPKGDIFAVSRIAGILGAKSVPQLIPLCHQIPLTSVRIKFRIDLPNDRVFVFCRAKAIQAKTGVEMEAMTGCSLAALTIYDMTKSATLGIQIGSVKLLGKKGGRKDFGQTEMDN